MNEQAHESLQNQNGTPAKLTGPLAEAVRRICVSPAPPESLARAVERARSLEAQPTFQSVKKNKPSWIAKAIIGLAACLLLAMAIYLLQPRPSLAAMANALAQQTWIHVSSIDPDGTRDETWLSPDRRITAGKTPQWIELHDEAMRVYYSYDVKGQTLYRVPQPDSRGPAFHLLVFDSIRAVAAENRSDPLRELKFVPQDQAHKLTLLSQKRRTLREGGRQWLEVELTIRIERLEEPARMILRIDRQTNLPHTWRCEYQQKGSPQVVQAQFDYPQFGPHDIYDLGVSRDVQFVDRVPRGDVARLMAGVLAERHRLDNYACLMHQRMDDNQYWWNDHPFRVFHKGNRYRYEFGMAFEPTEKPPENASLSEWWRQRSKQIYFRPQSIITGGKQYQIQLEGFRDASGRPASRVKAVKEVPIVRHGEEWFPLYYGWTPEFAARFPLGVGRQDFEAIANLNAAGGPPETILLRLAHKGNAPGAENSNPPPGVTIPDAYRYWIAPERSHLILQTEFLDNLGEVTHRYLVEESAKSPAGCWYPEVIRTESQEPNAGQGPSLKGRLFFYVDFEAELPDELFDLPAIGQIFAAPSVAAEK